MPVFYIQLDNGDGTVEDLEGLEFPDLQVARKQALCGGADILAEELKEGRSDVSLILQLEDAHHRPLRTVILKASVIEETIRSAIER